MGRRRNALRRRSVEDREELDGRRWRDALSEAWVRAAACRGGGARSSLGTEAWPTLGVAPDVRYEPTPSPVVSAMLRLGAVTAADRVYDLGCGDGRVVIAAARFFGAFAVGVDLDPARIAEAVDNAGRAGVLDRVRFLGADVMGVDLADATVVTLFLSPRLNLRLRPKLLRELETGARVVSHWHDMGDWRPRRVERVRSQGVLRPLYLWSIRPG